MTNEEKARAIADRYCVGAACWTTDGYHIGAVNGICPEQNKITAALDEKDQHYTALVAAVREVKALKDDGYPDVHFNGGALRGLLDALAAITKAEAKA